MTERRGLSRLGDDVRRELRRFEATGSMAGIVSAWPAATGPAIAANAWPARLARDGTLHVSTSSSVWAFELTHLEATLLEKLAGALAGAAPGRLRFRVGSVPADGAADGRSAATRDAPRPSTDDLRTAEEFAGRITNQELRELVARAAAASLARSGSDRSF